MLTFRFPALRLELLYTSNVDHLWSFSGTPAVIPIKRPMIEVVPFVCTANPHR